MQQQSVFDLLNQRNSTPYSETESNTVVLRVEDYLTSELEAMVKQGIPDYVKHSFNMKQVIDELKGRIGLSTTGNGESKNK
jgi:hypothetical protein